ncbi:hypothetical protein G3I60_34305 [Streptomyces sp. SID13666]|uniref:hypothetical protein n=1 Tax=unclassified Streptomyces TaxID=2593676 RepID=UPI0013BEF728|nr:MULTISPECIES: hypothetical protein [unclassified Streptomyces]NEA59097.1 hypothetical protein [Streptomyces sp. SID13666]NEA75135.1 hypothetical protein [Streptomyces sp. SID13588]
MTAHDQSALVEKIGCAAGLLPGPARCPEKVHPDAATAARRNVDVNVRLSSVCLHDVGAQGGNQRIDIGLTLPIRILG